jgi:hypothetical protein
MLIKSTEIIYMTLALWSKYQLPCFFSILYLFTFQYCIIPLYMNCMKCPCLSVSVIWQGSRTVDISVCSRIRRWRGTKWGTNLMYDKGLEQGTWRYYAVLEGEEVQNGEETWKLVLTSQWWWEQVIFNDMMMISALYKTTFIVLFNWDNSQWECMWLHSDTLSWFPVFVLTP